jgi:hypothetical protein
LPRDPKVFWALSSAYQQAGRPQEAARARAIFARLRQQDAGKAQSTESGESPDVVISVTDGSESAPHN